MALFPYRTKSKATQRKCDSIFQIVHYIVHNGKKHNPLHVSLAEVLHNDLRSKLLIGILNKLGLCISYDEVQRIDFGLMDKIIDAAGPNRVPVSLPIDDDDVDDVVIHGAMDNFDHDEATLSGIGGSHDTILMLFRNGNVSKTSSKILSSMPSDSTQKQKCLKEILPCQELVRMGKFSGRGKIPKTFSPGDENDLSWKEKELDRQYRLWIISRYQDQYSAEIGPQFPSFSALKSLLDSSTFSLTYCAFTPILPYPATEYDTIFTTMINYQDVLKQSGCENGPLWSDERVYHVAKELQLLNPKKFENIFLGLGGFHLEKVVIGCLGAYLESSGIQHLLVEERVYGPAVVNYVMSGGNYIRGKRGMSIIAETMGQLQIGSFLESSNGEIYSELFRKIDELLLSVADSTNNQIQFTSLWSDCMNELDEFEAAFDAFKIRGSAESSLFAFWNNFLSNLFPVLRDLTRSFRDADWNLHLSSLNRSINLCFSFDRINYKRWLPIYYEDCLALPEHFPKMHESFVNGDFVVRHTLRKGSAVPMDQALEKAYNKPAKSAAGIIGFTRRKAAVCKWNLIKHEKANYRNFLYDICEMGDDDEYNLHYEFSESVTKADKTSVVSLMRNITQRTNPFDLDQCGEIMNIATGAILEQENKDFLLNCNALGKDARKEFYR